VVGASKRLGLLRPKYVSTLLSPFWFELVEKQGLAQSRTVRFHSASHSNAHRCELDLTGRMVTAPAEDRILGVTNGPLLVNCEHCNCLCQLG
jgi:hypothetical protein